MMFAHEPSEADAGLWTCNCDHCLVWQAAMLVIARIALAAIDGEDHEHFLQEASPAVRRILDNLPEQNAVRGVLDDAPEHSPD